MSKVLPHIDGIGDVGEGAIVPLQPPSPKRQKLERNSDLHVAKARAVVEKNRLQRKLNAATALLANRDEKLLCVSIVLGGGVVVGSTREGAVLVQKSH